MTETMPSNLLAEKTAIASSIIFPDLLDEFAALLDPQDFYSARNQLIFETIMGLYSKSIPVDVAVLTSELEGQNKIDAAGGIEYISKLLEEPVAVDVEHYTRLIKDKKVKRQLIETANACMKATYRDDEPAALLLDKYQETFLGIGNGNQTDCAGIKQLVVECSDQLEYLHNNPGIVGIPSGFYDLDSVLGGFHKTDLYVIGARPSMGKTALALTIARNSARLGNCIGFFSLEMSRDQIAARLVSMESGVNLLKFRNGKFDGNDWDLINSAFERLSATQIFIDDAASLSYGEIRRRARRYKKRHQVDLFVIDYLQLAQGDKQGGRVEEISSISRNLKAMAKELKCPVIALSQLNRSCETRDNKRPRLADLRDSGAIEQDADAVAFVYRDEVYYEDTPNPGLAEILVAKQRNGPTGSVRLAFNRKFARFDNLKQDADETCLKNEATQKNK